MMKFEDRIHAGRLLTNRLSSYQENNNTVVLALPRGGIPIAYEIAKSLYLPFDVFLVRKLCVPSHEELAMGAITLDSQVFNTEVIKSFKIDDESIQKAIVQERQELLRRNEKYRNNRLTPHFTGKTLILVDDGLATGATMRAAILSLKQQNPKKIVIAIPVAPPEAKELFANSVDELICLQCPEDFHGVGYWYLSFPQLTDQEVGRYLLLAQQRQLLVET